jgi:hypothetical protein
MKLKDLLIEGQLTPAAKKCIEVVTKEFGRSSFPMIGTFNDRNVAGTSIKSQHAFGNAVDFHVPDELKYGPVERDSHKKHRVASPEGKILGDRVKDFLLQHVDDLDIQLIIWYREDWNRSTNFRKGSYDGVHPHYNHVHVDFIRGKQLSSPNYTNRKNNKFLVDLIGAYYDISTKNPSGYFKQFYSWNPFAPGIGDNEEGAAAKLINRFETYKPKLKQIESDTNTSREDLENIQRIREIIDILYQAILDGRSEKFDVDYFKLDTDTNLYKRKTLTFNWNYL